MHTDKTSMHAVFMHDHLIDVQPGTCMVQLNSKHASISSSLVCTTSKCMHAYIQIAGLYFTISAHNS